MKKSYHVIIVWRAPLLELLALALLVRLPLLVGQLPDGQPAPPAQLRLGAHAPAMAMLHALPQLCRARGPSVSHLTLHLQDGVRHQSYVQTDTALAAAALQIGSHSMALTTGQPHNN